MIAIRTDRASVATDHRDRPATAIIVVSVLLVTSVTRCICIALDRQCLKHDLTDTTRLTQLVSDEVVKALDVGEHRRLHRHVTAGR